MSDFNIFALLPGHLPHDERYKPESIILLLARMDSFSIFNEAAPGLRSVIGNVVAVLAIAEALGRFLSVVAVPDRFKRNFSRYFTDKNAYTGHRRIMIGLLNGESFEYIGSSRMVFNAATL